MTEGGQKVTDVWPEIVKAERKESIFGMGDEVRISMRFPIGHIRVPNYIRGKKGVVEAVIEPALETRTKNPETNQRWL